MPVKRRADKRRVSPEREYEAWAPVFNAGYDFFDDLPAIGLTPDAYSRVAADMARDPWARFGERYLAEHPHGNTSWAEQEFGRPWETTDA